MTDNFKFSLAVLAAGSLLWSACTADRQPCLTPKIASLNVRCVRVASAVDTTAVDTALPSAVFRPLTATGAAGTLYPSQSAFVISLSSVADTCQWLVAADTAGVVRFDTLTFYYERKLQFISNACGFAYFYDMDSVHTSHNFIDSLRITNINVTNNVNTSHLQVYIHPNF